MQGGKAHIQWPDYKVVLHFIQSTGSSSFGLLKTQDLSMSTALLLLIIFLWLICLLPASSQSGKKKLYLMSVYTMLPLSTQLIFSNKQWLSMFYCFCWEYTCCGAIQVGNMNLCQTKRVRKEKKQSDHFTTQKSPLELQLWEAWPNIAPFKDVRKGYMEGDY